MQQQNSSMKQLRRDYQNWFEGLDLGPLPLKSRTISISNHKEVLATYDIYERKLIFFNATADHTLEAEIEEPAFA
jgi:hypothetical protein